MFIKFIRIIKSNIESNINFLINLYSLKISHVNYSFIHINGVLRIRNAGKISISENATINSGQKYNPIGGDSIAQIICMNNAEIIIGKNFRMSNSTLVSHQKIIIHDNVFIGGGVKIWDTDFHSMNILDRMNEDKNINTAQITIHNNVFIGANTIILKGVSIGKNSIIGAGSVVTKSIPENSVYAGNPAKKIS